MTWFVALLVKQIVLCLHCLNVQLEEQLVQDVFALNQLLFKVNKLHKKRIELDKKTVDLDILAFTLIRMDVLKLEDQVKWFVVLNYKMIDVPLRIKQEVK